MIERVADRWDVDVAELVIQSSFYLGILSLGIAVGTGNGLNVLQWACIDVGALPFPGSVVLPGTLDGNACYEGAKRLQSTARVAALVGGGFLSVGFFGIWRRSKNT